ncbi:MAG TPA: flagellin [Candidatus Anaerobiospirillum stercoravium]|nr:flagellin [Candidatus Anaerobiospirillum stercoravium]
MALYVNTNVSSLNAQRKLTNSTNSLNVSYQRLASGLRINSAKDDAAGLMISNRLTSQINGLDQGNRNANDGIALAQTIEGALDETTNMLQRIRTLAVQSANGTNSTEDRAAIQREVTQLCYEISRIAKDTTFAGKTILDGAFSATNNFNSLIPSSGILTFHVGSNQDNVIQLDWQNSFNLSGIISLANNLGGTLTAAMAANASSGIFQTGADGQALFDVQTRDAAEKVIGLIDDYIQAVDGKRADLGAIQNRMEATIRNQANISENESDARSRIRDTDFASETAALTQNNIIQQASQTVLAQANQRPTIALSLLGS